MPTLRFMEGLTVYDRKGGVLGRVTRALCHPEDPVVVGVEVQPPSVAYVVSRSPRYIALPGLTVGEDRLDVTDDVKDWSGTRGEKSLGFEWESTVIWVGMPLMTEADEQLGYVSDGSFDLPDGRLRDVLITEGIASDVTVGTRKIDGALLVGYRDGAVRVKGEAAEAAFSGGLAAKAGGNVAVAKVVAGEAGKTAIVLGGKAIKAAAQSKTAKSAWEMFKDTGKAFRDGMKGEDE